MKHCNQLPNFLQKWIWPLILLYDTVISILRPPTVEIIEDHVQAIESTCYQQTHSISLMFKLIFGLFHNSCSVIINVIINGYIKGDGCPEKNIVSINKHNLSPASKVKQRIN